MRSTGLDSDVTADKRRRNRGRGASDRAFEQSKNTSYQQVLTVARGGIEPATFRFSGGVPAYINVFQLVRVD